MIGMDSYLNAYVDRRMKLIVEEWELCTGRELDGFTRRLAVLEEEIPQLQGSFRAASDKLTALESRARQIKGRK